MNRSSIPMSMLSSRIHQEKEPLDHDAEGLAPPPMIEITAATQDLPVGCREETEDGIDLQANRPYGVGGACHKHSRSHHTTASYPRQEETASKRTSSFSKKNLSFANGRNKTQDQGSITVSTEDASFEFSECEDDISFAASSIVSGGILTDNEVQGAGGDNDASLLFGDILAGSPLARPRRARSLNDVEFDLSLNQVDRFDASSLVGLGKSQSSFSLMMPPKKPQRALSPLRHQDRFTENGDVLSKADSSES